MAAQNNTLDMGDVGALYATGGISPAVGTPVGPGLSYQSGPVPTNDDGSIGVLDYSTGQQPAAAPGGSNLAAQQAAAAQKAQVSGYYDNLSGNVNNQIGRLDTQQGIGNQNILDAYQTQLNQLQQGKARTTQDYQTTKATDLSDNVKARGEIAFNTGQQTNSLQRLLGSHGFGNSLAASQGVPYLTALAGTQQTSKVADAFGRNQQSLDTNYNRYLGDEFTSEHQLGQDRNKQLQQMQSTIDSRKSDLLAQLANIAQQRVSAGGGSLAQAQAASQPFQNQINDMGGQIDQLGRDYASPVLQANTPTYQAPTLSSYDFQPQASAQLGSQAGGLGGNISPFVNLLLNSQNQRDKQNVNNIGF